MNRIATALLAALVTVGSLSALSVADPGAPEFPDDRTPGVVASTNAAEVCGYVGGLSYSKRHRATTPEMKREVRQRYNVPREWRGEIDHRLPLALGGADDIRNLWPQTDFKPKDELELRTWEAVCRYHTLTLEQGQAIFLGDWRRSLAR